MINPVMGRYYLFVCKGGRSDIIVQLDTPQDADRTIVLDIYGLRWNVHSQSKGNWYLKELVFKGIDTISIDKVKKPDILKGALQQLVREIP